MSPRQRDHSTYTQNRDRLIAHEAIKALFAGVMKQAEEQRLLSAEHFSVDGTLIRAWASHKSFVPKDGPPPDKGGSGSNPEVDFKGRKRSNDTHASTTNRMRDCSPSRTRPQQCPRTCGMH